MTKGKKQDGLDHELLLSLEAGARLGEREVGRLAELLSRGVLQNQGKDYLLVYPRGEASSSVRFQRTPIGSLAPTVLSTLGLWDVIVDTIVQRARPRCVACGELADGMEAMDRAMWPQDGYVALVLDGIEETVSLKDQCELLGVERALVAGRLVRADDVEDELGEPVLKVIAAANPDECEREIALWFAKGSKAFRLVQFVARDAQGRDIQRVSNEWRCLPCKRSYAVATREALENAENCQRCRGEGWISVEGERYVACQDCNGFGSQSLFAEYEFDGVPLRRVATCTLGSVVTSFTVAASEGMVVELDRLSRVSEWGLSSYPIGMPSGLLSRGERTLVTVISARLSQFSEMFLVVDGGVVGGDSATLRELSEQGDAPSLRVLPAFACRAACARQEKTESEILTLREIHRGPLTHASIEIPRGELTAIVGELGVGKNLLLREIHYRFGKRKKLQHLASFGGIKKSYILEMSDDMRRCVLDLLGIGASLASDIARTRHARERGVSEEDLLWRRSKHFCSACLDGHEQGECPVCWGTLVDDRIGSLEINGTALATLMTAPLGDVARILWANDEVAALLGRLPEELRSSLSLATPIGRIAPPTRRFLEIFAPLVRLGTRGAAVAGDLILLDRPFATSTSLQSLIIEVMQEVQGRGGTVVCAGVPKPLEHIFHSVLRLRTVHERKRCEMVSEFFDVRLARRVEVSVDGAERSN